MIPDFWRLTFRQWTKLFLRLDFAIVVLSGIVIGIAPEWDSLLKKSDLILATEASVTVALLGLVIAALAVVIAFLNEDLIALLDSQGGLSEDIWAFSFTSLLAATTAAVSLAALILLPEDGGAMLRPLIGLTWGLFLWTLFSTVALVRVVHGYGILRSTMARKRVGSDQS